jgi:hypothetical protein
MRLVSIASLAAALVAGLAPAATADGRQPGSLLIYPFQQSALLNNAVFTVVNVTNTNRAGSATTDVHYQYVNVVDGTSPLFANCSIADRVETLTPADTLSVLTSCHNSVANAQGYLVVSAMDPDQTDTYWSFNHLIGSEQVVTAGGGMYSLNALPFRSPRAFKTNTDVDLDLARDFDGVEYEAIADELYIDSYIGALPTQLVLISFLGGEYLNEIEFVIFNDDEIQLSGDFAFACWSRTPMSAMSGFFSQQGLITTVNDPRELDLDCNGVGDLETGWAIVRPSQAISITSPTIDDPAILGALTVDGVQQFNNGRLLWESVAKQTNGRFPN